MEGDFIAVISQGFEWVCSVQKKEEEEWVCLFSYFDPHLVGLLADILSSTAVSFSGISIKFSVPFKKEKTVLYG